MSDESRPRRPGRPRRYKGPRRDIHVSLPEQLVDALDAAAGGEGRSVYIERLLREALHIADETVHQMMLPESG